MKIDKTIIFKAQILPKQKKWIQQQKIKSDIFNKNKTIILGVFYRTEPKLFPDVEPFSVFDKIQPNINDIEQENNDIEQENNDIECEIDWQIYLSNNDIERNTDIDQEEKNPRRGKIFNRNDIAWSKYKRLLWKQEYKEIVQQHTRWTIDYEFLLQAREKPSKLAPYWMNKQTVINPFPSFCFGDNEIQYFNPEQPPTALSRPMNKQQQQQQHNIVNHNDDDKQQNNVSRNDDDKQHNDQLTHNDVMNISLLSEVLETEREWMITMLLGRTDFESFKRWRIELHDHYSKNVANLNSFRPLLNSIRSLQSINSKLNTERDLLKLSVNTFNPQNKQFAWNHHYRNSVKIMDECDIAIEKRKNIIAHLKCVTCDSINVCPKTSMLIFLKGDNRSVSH